MSNKPSKEEELHNNSGEKGKKVNMSNKPNKTLYWVKLIEQSSGNTLDAYFEAESITKLDEGITDILEIKVIKEVIQL